MNPNDQPLLIALVAVQFLVHAMGWAMAARLSQGWRAAEGQFAASWLLLATGLMLYVPPWASGSPPRNLGDLLIIASAILQHRGMALHWGRPPNDRAAALMLAGAAAVLLLSFGLANGHGVRVAAVCVGVSAMLLATARILWQRRRRPFVRSFTAVLAATHALLAGLLLARAVQALLADGGTKISIDAPHPSNIALVIAVMFVGGLINLAQIYFVLGRVLQRLTSQAMTDALTGAVNRRGLLQHLDDLHQRAQRGAHGYAVLMVDVDHFKAVNDRHGHAVGDRTLRRVAQCLRDGLRVGDVVARWGGEEFCVLLPRISLDEAQALAARVAQQIAASGEPAVTVSIGVAEVQARLESAEQVIRRADDALYRAKHGGRNRVVTAPAALPA